MMGHIWRKTHLHTCKCILFVAYMNKLIPGRGCGLPPSPPPPIPSRGLGEGGVGSRPHPLPQSPPGDWEKGVWAPALTPSPNPLPGTGRRGCGLPPSPPPPIPSRGLGEGGVGSRPHPLPQSPPGDWEKGVWARKRLASFLFKFTSSCLSWRVKFFFQVRLNLFFNLCY